MKRNVYIAKDEITMLYARESDRAFIYEQSTMDPQIVLSMFDDPSEFRWEEFRDEKAKFFDETASIYKYLLIEYQQEIVGVFYHTCHLAPIKNVEFHIWFFSNKFTGKGLGTRVVSMMKDYIHSTYGITCFMMRPWIKNPRAIHTYEKCGFVVQKDFELSKYFTQEEIELYGYGAYSVEETVNMIALI